MIYRLIVEHSHGKSFIDGGCNDQNIYTLAICLWGPQTIANLAYTTQFTMVYGTYRYSWWDLETIKCHWGNYNHLTTTSP